MTVLASFESERNWAADPSTKNVVAQVTPSFAAEWKYAKLPYLAFKTDLEVVEFVQWCLRMQGRPDSDIHTINFDR